MTENQKWQQFINKDDGSCYWGPAESSNKITNVRRWEQAFRVYAAVYTAANPERSGEIWQYVYVINSAAASYSWENVAYYDFTFRQLMSEKPHRSWGKIYSQLWNLAMRDPLQRSTAQSSGSNTTQGDWKEKCCWRYNKGGKCKKWNCKYDHRCNLCGSWTHNKHTVVKINQQIQPVAITIAVISQDPSQIKVQMVKQNVINLFYRYKSNFKLLQLESAEFLHTSGW